MRLSDKVIVVTGSTRGIGRDIARVAAREGALVVLSGRNAPNGRKALAAIRQDGGSGCFIRADVSEPEDCYRLIDETVKKYGKIDGLVNNAGIFPYHQLLEVTPEEFEQVINTNLKGSFFCAQRAIAYMQKQGGGSIVNIESTHWELGTKMLPVYSMSKGGMHTMTNHIAHHFAPYGIRCNGVIVGWVLSEGESDRMHRLGLTDEEIEAEGRKYIPSGTFQTGEDIGNACVFLLSDESKQAFGTHIEITGGFRTGGSID